MSGLSDEARSTAILQEHKRISEEISQNVGQTTQLINLTAITIAAGATAGATRPQAFALVPFFLYTWGLRAFAVDRDTIRLKAYRAELEQQLQQIEPSLQLHEERGGQRKKIAFWTALTSGSTHVIGLIVKCISVGIVARYYGGKWAVAYIVVCVMFEGALGYMIVARSADQAAEEALARGQSKPKRPALRPWAIVIGYAFLVAIVFGTSGIIGATLEPSIAPPKRSQVLAALNSVLIETRTEVAPSGSGVGLIAVRLAGPGLDDAVDALGSRGKTLRVRSRIRSLDVEHSEESVPQVIAEGRQISWSLPVKGQRYTVEVVFEWREVREEGASSIIRQTPVMFV